MSRRPIAHTPSTPGGMPHDLEAHLNSVGTRTAAFARKFRAARWGEIAGNEHDRGKYGIDFQNYLDDCIEARRLGMKPRPRKIDHSIAGAQHAVALWGALGELLAFVIAGHHAGLADYPIANASGEDAGGRSLKARLKNTERLSTALAGSPPENILRSEVLALPVGVNDVSLFARMIFSALIDADRIDTELFYSPERAAIRTRAAEYDSISLLCDRLETHMRGFVSAKPTRINSLRAQLLQDCILASGYSPGLYSLTAPTGLGKTLAGLNFSLRHALQHNKTRVIYVAPYTSIIEQTARVYRDALGSHNVLEHHSLFDPTSLTKEANEIDSDSTNEAELMWRMTVENWDAPVIVTTAVQFFESLFSAHPSKCRKLHNIANSVVFLDEAQMIPADFLYPILRVLSELMNAYNVTIVLSTATQPALDPRKRSMSLTFNGLSGPAKIVCNGNATPNHRTEIVQDVQALHEATRRFKVVLPDFDQPRPSWDALAERIIIGGSSLTIVNTRSNSRDLYKVCASSSGIIHLSALMCPAHRLAIIHDIKRRLRQGETLRVISTQLVEAGVDLDFPDVYRALAGLDSLAQAGGRCNRNGLAEFGRLIIFESPDEKLPPALFRPQAITRDILRGSHDDLFSPEMFELFFRKLFWQKGDRGLDARGICALLPTDIDDVREICFRTASDRFRIIEDHRKDVIVPWGDEGSSIVDQLRLDPTELGIEGWREILRKGQRYCVGINQADYDTIIGLGGINIVGKLSLLDGRFYDEALGVVVDPIPDQR